MKNKTDNLLRSSKKTLIVGSVVMFCFLILTNNILSLESNHNNSNISINEYFGHYEKTSFTGTTIRIYEGSSTYEYQLSGRPLYYKSDTGIFSIWLYADNEIIEVKEVGLIEESTANIIGIIIDDKDVEQELNKDEKGTIQNHSVEQISKRMNINIRGKNRINLDVLVKSSDTNEAFRSPSIMSLGQNRVDVLIRPKGMTVREIIIEKYNPNEDFDLGFETLSNDFSVNGENVINAFAMDPSRLDFESGTFTFIAMGTKFWKCEEWDFDNQNCYGEWVHVMDTMPGQTYDINFDAVDPGYAQTGVSPVNTRKSAYLPGEEAEIMIVVLDSRGFPVVDAYVELQIITPSGTDYVFTTNDNINSETRGIYDLLFQDTDELGLYILNVRAEGFLTDTYFSSYFEVKEEILFDMIRNAPIIIDPWTGKYNSEVTIFSKEYEDTFSYYESVPSSFLISDVGDAELIYESDRILIVWHELRNGTMINYSFNAPLISPAVHYLGESYVLYENESEWIQYKEARPWFIASDPAAYYDPNSTIASGWDSGTGTTHTEIDDGTRQPTVPNTADYVASAMNANQVSTFGFPNVTQQGVSSITLWVYTSTGNTAQYTFALQQGTNNVCTNAVPGNTASQWRSCTWSNPTGSLADLRINLGIVTRATGGPGSNALVYAAYIEVTYDEPPNVTLNNPINNGIVENSTVDFNFTVIDDTASTLQSCGLYTNFTGTFSQNASISSVPNGTWSTITVPNIVEGPWLWNVNCTDNANNSAFALNNFTVRINSQAPNITNVAFNESSISQGRSINLSMNITDYWGIDYAEATVLLPNGTSTVYELNRTEDIFWLVFNETILTGTYNLTGVFANDTLGKNVTVNFDNISFNVTTVIPDPFNLLNPSNNTISNNRTPFLEWEQTQTDNFANYTIQFSENNDFSVIELVYYTFGITDTNYTIITELSSDTTYYWRVIAYDIFGNQRISNQNYLYVTDNTPPSVTLNSPSNLDYSTINPTVFNATATDLHDIQSCSLYTNNTGSWILNQTNSSVTSGVPVIFSMILIEGPILWNVLCNDIAGNSEFASSNRTVVVDLSAPIITLLDPANESLITTSNTITFNASAIDTYSDLNSCSLMVNGTVEDNTDSVTNDVPFLFTRFLLNEYYYWQVNCTDIHGFEGISDNYYIEVLVTDSDPPLITLDSPLNNSYINSTTVVLYYTPEDATGINSCSLYINNTINQTDNSITNLVQNNFTVTGFTEDIYEWRVDCIDSTPEENLGMSDTSRFIVDVTPPTVTLNTPLDLDFRNSLTVSFNATATDLNVSYCELYTNSSGSWSVSGNNSNVLSGQSFLVSGSVVEGPILWNVLCHDQAGNNALATNNRTVNVDITDPTFLDFSVEPSSPQVYTPSLIIFFNVTVNDSFSGVHFVEFEHNAYGSFQIFNASNLGSGIYQANLSGISAKSFSYRWRARDNANNQNITSYTSYTINKAMPDLQLLFNGTSDNISIVEEQPVNITGLMSVPPSQNIALYIDSVLISESQSPLYYNFVNETPGSYNVTVIVNESENYTRSKISRFITINDTRAPIITLLLPLNNSVVGVTNVIFSYNVSDSSDIQNCSLIINGTIDQTDTSVLKDTAEFFLKTLTNDYYSWRVACYDNHDNYAETDIRFFTVQESDKVNVVVYSDKALYEQGELIDVFVETYDDFNNPINASTRTDLFRGLGDKPWWNTSYNSRYAIIVNETSGSNLINGIIEVNLTGFQNSISDCRHIRIVGHEDTIMTPTSYGVFTGDNNSWCQVLFRANITADSVNDDTYYVYYNTSSASVYSNLLTLTGWQNYFATVSAADEGTPTNVANIIGSNDANFASMSQGGGGGTHSAHGSGFITGNPTGTILGVEARYRYAVPAMCGTCTWQLRSSVNSGASYTNSFTGVATAGLTTSSWVSLTSSYASLTWTNLNNTRLQGRMVKTGGGGTGTLDLYWVEMNVTYKIASNINQSDLGNSQIFVMQDINESGVSGIRNYNLSSLSLLVGNYSIVSIASATDLNNGTNFSSFEVIEDIVDPVITLVYPENGSLFYEFDINFTFIPSDVNLDSCSLYVNNVLEYSNSSPINDAQNNVTLTLGLGNYNWTVECNDTAGNVGIAENFSFTIADSDIIVEQVLITDPITLVAANTTQVYCNSTVFGTVDSHTAYLYADSSFAGDMDSNFTHYTNSSCDYSSNVFSCSFDMLYYAVNGTWSCTFSATGLSNSENLTNTTTVEPLIALGVNESVIDYLNLSPADTSEIVEVRVYNYGNQPMDLRLYGYGAIENDGKLLDCPSDFIPESYQRFSINTIEDFGDMTNLSANSTIPNVIALNLGTGSDSSVTSYWRLQIPQLFEEAECQGSVVFVATLSS